MDRDDELVIVETPNANLNEEYVQCRQCQLPYRRRIMNGVVVACCCPYCGYNEALYDYYAFEPVVKGNTIVFHVAGVRKKA